MAVVGMGSSALATVSRLIQPTFLTCFDSLFLTGFDSVFLFNLTRVLHIYFQLESHYLSYIQIKASISPTFLIVSSR